MHSTDTADGAPHDGSLSARAWPAVGPDRTRAAADRAALSALAARGGVYDGEVTTLDIFDTATALGLGPVHTLTDPNGASVRRTHRTPQAAVASLTHFIVDSGLRAALDLAARWLGVREQAHVYSFLADLDDLDDPEDPEGPYPGMVAADVLWWSLAFTVPAHSAVNRGKVREEQAATWWATDPHLGWLAHLAGLQPGEYTPGAQTAEDLWAIVGLRAGSTVPGDPFATMLAEAAHDALFLRALDAAFAQPQTG